MLEPFALIPASNQSSTIIQATGNPALDTATLQAAFDRYQNTGTWLKLVGKFVIRPSADISWYERRTFPVHIGVVMRSGININAAEAQFRLERPVWAAATDVFFFFGTGQSFTRRTLRDCTWDGGLFNFVPSQGGLGQGRIYAHGVISFDNFERRNVTYYYPNFTDAIRGRGLYAENCTNRRSFNMKFFNLQQCYYAHYDDGVIDDGLYATGFQEFYDFDGVHLNGVVTNVRLENARSNTDQCLDMASLQNFVISNVSADQYRIFGSLYVKPRGAWPTYYEFSRAITGETLLPPIVTIDTTADTLTWEPGDWLVQADGRVGLETTGALPTGLADETLYYIVGSSITGNDTIGWTAKISATKGGSALAFSGTQSGVHRATRYPDPATMISNKNVTIKGLRGTRGSTTTQSTFSLGAYQSQFYRAGCDNQNTNVTVEDVKLKGGTSFSVNEGKGIVIRDVVLEDFVPSNETLLTVFASPAAFMARQIRGSFQTTQSILTGSFEDIKIVNSSRAGIIFDTPGKITANRLTVDGYNSVGAAALSLQSQGIGISQLGLRTGSYLRLGDVDVTTTAANSTDMFINVATSPSAYNFRQSGSWWLRTAASGFRNLYSEFLDIEVEDANVLSLPACDTTAGAVYWWPLKSFTDRYGVLVFARVDCHEAITAQPTDNTRLRLNQSTAGVVSTNAAALIVDGVAHAADTMRIMNIDPTARAQTLIAPGSLLLAFVDRANMGGSIIPATQLSYGLLTYFK